MIPRTLVPWNARPPDVSAEAGQKTTTALDERTLVPSYFVHGPLETKTSIPASLPLESIAARLVVPRDLPFHALEIRPATAAVRLRPMDLDLRVVIPSDAAPPVFEARPRFSPDALPEVIDRDIFTTGNVNLLVSPEARRESRAQRISRMSSIVFHALLIVFILVQPKLFPQRPPTQDELEMARRSLQLIPLYLPPSVSDVPRVPSSPNEPRSERMHIDPRILRQIAPNVEPQPLPGKPEPERVVRDLPDAPQPKIATPAPDAPKEQLQASRPAPKLETPDDQPKSQGLILRRVSPGKALEESMREAARAGGGRTGAISGPMPGGGAGSPGGGGSASQGLLTNGYELLTPTEGVDFSNYLARVLASVRRNWYAVIPQSARLGDRGRVILQFRIMKVGDVPLGEPALLATSGKQPLDAAAISAIRASSPFEPLPPAFSGPYIELRFIFLYNLPLSAAQ
jgi:hypothetical protein